jgi:hypothetical protein
MGGLHLSPCWASNGRPSGALRIEGYATVSNLPLCKLAYRQRASRQSILLQQSL